MIETVISFISNALYTYVLIVLLVLCGLYFTFRTKFVQFRLFKEQLKCVTEKGDTSKGVSSFQALMVSTASRVGTGNIIGVSTAICLGGYGAVFWMWVIATVGSASALIESTLAQIFKKRGQDGWYGGPAYYIEAAIRSRPLAVLFSVFLILTYGFGFNMLASYNMQSTLSVYSFYSARYTPWIVGGILSVLVAVCLFGGGKRIVKVTELLVPVMGVLYIAVALFVVVKNVGILPNILSKIFTDAFDFTSIFGGFGGSCLMYGIKRGLFSNEAGVGSAPNASAAAEVAHPVKQGLVQVLSVFIDTLLICTATAFMCLCSGVEPSEALSGAPYVQAASLASLGKFGPIFITVAMFMFGFTTLLGNLYYADRGIEYIAKKKLCGTSFVVYNAISSLVVFIGAGLSADLLWDIADITMGAMALINIPVIFILGKYAIRALRDFDRKTRDGKTVTFKAKDIGLPYDVEAWK